MADLFIVKRFVRSIVHDVLVNNSLNSINIWLYDNHLIYNLALEKWLAQKNILLWTYMYPI